jgi:hypothetical protein
MAAMDVLKVEQGWGGDRLRNRAIVTINTSDGTDTLAPSTVGLNDIFAITPTGRLGTIDGETCVSCGSVSYQPADDVTLAYNGTNGDALLESGNIEVFVYGK